ncbi:MAG: hypothetical protein AAB788_04330 [Patescibacteria group bacterium]
MCPACILTIGGGLLIAKKLGVNDILAISLLTILLSIILDVILRKFNHGKVFFPYQRVVISTLILLIVMLLFKIS